MKAGIIGIVHGDFGTVHGQTQTKEQDGTSLQRCIEVSDTVTLDSGKESQIGSVAKEELVTDETPVIQDGSVQMRSRREVETDHVRFATIPGEAVIRGTGKGNFAFDMIGREVETLIERCEVNLDAFVQDHEEATFWKYGFTDTGLNAEKGVFYGVEVEEDSNVQSFMSSSTANQIGFDMLYGDKPVKATMSQSGYLEVYQPEEWETKDYLQFISDEILPYIRSP